MADDDGSIRGRLGSDVKVTVELLPDRVTALVSASCGPVELLGLFSPCSGRFLTWTAQGTDDAGELALAVEDWLAARRTV